MGEKTQKIQQYKRDAVALLRDKIRQAPGLIFTDYRGLTVAQISDLRRTLRKQSAEYKVVKNSYAKIALAELGLPFQEGFLTNPTAIAMARTDVGPVAKVLFDFARESRLKVKGGMIDGKALEVLAVEAHFPAAGAPGAAGHADGHHERPPAQHDVRHEGGQLQAGAHPAGGGRAEGQRPRNHDGISLRMLHTIAVDLILKPRRR